MPVPQEILKLVERFEAQRAAYQSGKYNEAQIRAEFIDPFFKALGWDVHNEQGYAEAYKDVIHEDALKMGGATEAPDLCFRIGGTRKFFVECKKPSINIKDAVHPAYQLRRYAWSARLPLSILTDFDELAVYDCRAKPNKNDSASVCRLMYLTGKQYAEKWDEFTAIFSREAVLKGSFDKFAESAKGKKGTTGVDDAFLEEIERWREILAHNIALRNEKLSQRELNFAVQRTIDRIIFLRICEDRGIEPYGRLLTLKNGNRAYPRLAEFFRRADERYNSGIFCFTKSNESGSEPPDELTLTLAIDDKVIKDIVGNLYYPESPYEFSVLPAEILGHVYERFLGKVIRLTDGHQAKVEEKPEVRKAGGVYYTPTYIVDYIVKNTVGKLLEGKTPRQAAKLKILDPACGSGSFLLGAYQYLLNWHRDYYVQQMVDAASSRVPKRQDAASTSTIIPQKYFDPEEPVANLSGNLPHWRQAGTTYFVTFRCADSLPQSKLEQWEKEREEWLRRNPEPHSSKQRTEYYEQFVERLQAWLNSGYGACRLADHRAKAIVEEALKFFDGQRYRLGEFVVMPNHVHVLITPSGEHTLSDILHSWKSFTANKINELFGVAGEFWRKESFDHIVRNTDQLERIRIYIKENPKRLEASSTTIVDTASSRVPKRQDAASTLKLPIFQASGGDYRLTTTERKRILLNNIYGVDIDTQAVEVTKLSLLLKVLEGESQESITKQFELFHQRALPDLGNNIKCGNSLIGPDFYQQQEMKLPFFVRRSVTSQDSAKMPRGVLQSASLDDETRYRINAFDWQAEFPQVFGVNVDTASSRVPKRQDAASTLGGFDAVIGNPPWISLSGKFGNEICSKEEIAYLISRFQGNTCMPNVYEYFVAQGLNLVRPSGWFSFIVPDRLGYNAQFVQLRRRILTEARIVSLLYRAPFPSITADTLVFVFHKAKPAAGWSVTLSEFAGKSISRNQAELLQHPTHAFEYYENADVMALITSVSSCPYAKPLGQLCESTSGFGGKSSLIHTSKTNSQEIPTLKGDSIGRYELRKRYWFDFRRENITGRTTDKTKLGAIQKILIRKTGDTIIANFDDSGVFPEQSLYFLFNNQTNLDLKYILGLLNSRLLTTYYRAKSVTNKRSIAQVKKVDLDQLPIRMADLSNAADKSRHDKMVALVDRMLDLHKKLVSAKAPHDKESLQRQISATDREIDRLVYELYGLTEEEIKIVEEAIKSP